MRASDLGSVERREFLRRAGIVAGVAPVVVTVLASKAHAAPTCTSTNIACGGTAATDCNMAPNPPCCSMLTCQLGEGGGPLAAICVCR